MMNGDAPVGPRSSAADAIRAFARRRRRPLQILAAMVAAIIVLPLLVYQVSVQPGAAIIKWAFAAGEDPAPTPGSTLTEGGVTIQVAVPLPVEGTPAAALDLYTPSAEGASPRPIILWIHGGGFIANSSWMVHEYATKLAAEGYTVASLDYDLAPGAQYPTPIQQANAALAFMRDHAAEYGGDPTRFVVGGDSAGSQIASQLAAVQTDAAFAATVGVEPALADGQLRGAVLFCGLYDMSTVGSSGFPSLRTFLWAYTGQRDWEHFARIDELSTTKNATSAYPPTFIAVGDADPFDAQGHELASALEGRGVEVTTQFWNDAAPGLGHEYQFDLTKPQSVTTLDNVLAFLSQHTSKGGQ